MIFLDLSTCFNFSTFSFTTLTSGDPSTTVANAFHDPVFVKVDSERAHLDSISASAELEIGGFFSVGGSFSMEQTWNKFIDAGFARVNPLEFVQIYPEGDKVYISVWTAYEGFIWSNIAEEPNVNFIVMSDAGVAKSRYNSIWLDEDGVNLKPSKEDVEKRAAAAKAERDAAAKNEASGKSANFNTRIVQMCTIVFSLMKWF